MKDKPLFVWKTTVAEALGWTLHDKSLNQELTDQAEQQACAEIGEHFSEIEATVRIEMKDGYFVVSFSEKDWRLGLQNGDEIFVTDLDENLPKGRLSVDDAAYYGRMVKIHSIAFMTDSKKRTTCTIVEEDGNSFECWLEAIS